MWMGNMKPEPTPPTRRYNSDFCRANAKRDYSFMG